MNGLILAAVMMSIPDGSLLFVENGNEIVMAETESTLSHVAIIINEKGKPYVYEANPPRARRILLSDYIKSIKQENKRYHKDIRLWVRPPIREFSPRAVLKMKKYLESQMGRRYGLLSYLIDMPTKRLHCGELTTYALEYVGVHIHGSPHKQTPISISDSVNKFYGDFEEITLSMH